MAVAGLSGLTAACFSGDGTLGAVCFSDLECGLAQLCRDSICGQCGDGEVQPGEMCFGSSSEENVVGEVSDLTVVTIDGDLKLAAVVNGSCPMAPLSHCWGVYVLEVDPADGDFETSTPFGVTLPGEVTKLSVGDFDGHGEDDVAFAIIPDDPLSDKSIISVVYDFPVQASVDLDVSLIAYNLYAADLDGDGLDDLVIGGRVSSVISFLFADPQQASGFGDQRLQVSDLAPRFPAPVDMDNDGDLDLVIASAADATIGVDLNDGQGGFTPQARLSLDTNLAPAAVVTGDFDGDGNQDVAVVAPARLVSVMPPAFDPDATPSIWVYRGLGDGSLELSEVLPAGENPVYALATDINSDGAIDLVIADQGEDELPVFINRDGKFPDQVSIDVAAAPRTLLREDFDHDGVDDLVVGNANGVIAVVPSEN